MLISRTPLRCSIAGGGSDLDNFTKDHNGCVVSFAINKYVYVIIKERYDDLIVLNYTQHEIVDKVSDIKHDIIRECMQYAELGTGIEITTLADIPSTGTGLGSSSAITIGLLNAMFAYKGIYLSGYDLARIACVIEIDRLKKPIGRQDQYACAIGGLQKISFCQKDVMAWKFPARYHSVADNLFLHFTGITRDANKILEGQDKNTPDNIGTLLRLVEYAGNSYDAIINGDYDKIGEILGLSWAFKASLASGISNRDIDEIIARARDGGAIGSKICGAGGGGFLLSYVPNKEHARFREAMKDYRELKFSIDQFGSRIIFNIQ